MYAQNKVIDGCECIFKFVLSLYSIRIGRGYYYRKILENSKEI